MSWQVDVGATTLREANGQRVEALDQAHSIRVRMIRRERGQAIGMLAPVIRHEHAGILAAKTCSQAERLVTKLFVAATLSSGPAAIGSTMSDDLARGLSVSLTIAAVSAPAALAIAADSMRSSLLPDCETARKS